MKSYKAAMCQQAKRSLLSIVLAQNVLFIIMYEAQVDLYKITIQLQMQKHHTYAHTTAKGVCMTLHAECLNTHITQ